MSVLLGSSGASVILGSSGGGVVRRGGSSGKTLLTQSDFTYAGYYDVDLGGEFTLGQGLAYRYVGGQLRFLALTHDGTGVSQKLYEFAAPAINGTVTATTANWDDIWITKQGTAGGRFFGLWWDEAGSRLWSTSGIDYPDDTQIQSTLSMAITTLGSSGVVSAVRGLFGLENIGARRIYGGVTPIPSWFQTAYSTGAYGVGFGGYASRMAQGKTASMGPTLYAIADPTSLSDDASVAAANFKTLMDHGAGVGSDDWYTGKGVSAPTTYDRGNRIDDYTNFYDENGSYPSTPSDWNGPAPDDSLGRWVWGDSAYQTGVWIDLATKHGFVLMPTVHTGNVRYQTSTLNWDGKTAEFQVFNPDHFGEVINSTRQPWNVKPASQWRPTWGAKAPSNFVGNGNENTICAACFDTTANRLYARFTSHSGTWPYTKDRIFVWDVA